MVSVGTVRLILSKEVEMASLFKRKRKDGSHVWYVTGYVNGQHFMQSTGTGDKKLAQEVLKKVEEDNVRVEQIQLLPHKNTPILTNLRLSEIEVTHQKTNLPFVGDAGLEPVPPCMSSRFHCARK
jgi:hypothetical protein